MDSHKIVIGEVQGERRIVIFPLLAEGVGQPWRFPWHGTTHVAST